MGNQNDYTEQLLNLYEKFNNFQGDCSFLCEAITSMASEEEFLGQETALGISRYAHCVKRQTKILQRELKEIYVKAYTQKHSVPPRNESGFS